MNQYTTSWKPYLLFQSDATINGALPFNARFLKSCQGSCEGPTNNQFAPQLSEHFNKNVVQCIILGAIAIYAIVAVLGWFKDIIDNFVFSYPIGIWHHAVVFVAISWISKLFSHFITKEDPFRQSAVWLFIPPVANAKALSKTQQIIIILMDPLWVNVVKDKLRKSL